jgi:tetratricopeptide (TPR) repeat protein
MRQYSVFLQFPFLHYGYLLPWAVLGVVVFWKNRPYSSFINLFILANIIGMVIFYVSDRYRLPITPFVLIYAVMGFAWIWEKGIEKNIRPLVAGIVVVAVMYVVSFYNLADSFTTNFSNPLFNVAKYYQRQGRNEEALKLLEQNQKTWGTRGEVSEVMGKCHLGLGDYFQAEKCFDEAIRLAPNQFSGYFQRGRLWLARNQLETASNDFEKTLALNDTVPEAYYYLGAIRRQQNRPAEAQAALEKAHRLDPSIIPVYVELVQVYLSQGEAQKAGDLLEEGLRLAPQDQRLTLLREKLSKP